MTSSARTVTDYLVRQTANTFSISSELALSLTDKAVDILTQVALQAVAQADQALARPVRGLVSESAAVLSDGTDALTEALRGVGVEVDASVRFNSPEEARHWARVKAGERWRDVLVRVSMPSLSWRERQLVRETREGENESVSEEEREKEARERVRSYLRERGLLVEREGEREKDKEREDERECDVEVELHYIVAKYFTPPTVPLSLSTNTSSHTTSTTSLEGERDRDLVVPVSSDGSCCSLCQQSFSLSLFKHVCRACASVVCHSHSLSRRRIPRLGLVDQPVRVCDRCRESVDREALEDVLQWRDLRVRAYQRDELIPYTGQRGTIGNSGVDNR